MATHKNAATESVPSSTGTGAGSASNLTVTTPVVPQNPVATPVVAPATPRGFEESLEEMLHGFQTYVPSGFTLPTASGNLSQATIVAQLEATLALYSGYAQAKSQAKAAVNQAKSSLNTALPGAHTLYKTLKDGLSSFYGRRAIQLEQFGIPVKTAAKSSGIENAVRAAKAKLTRVQNGTLGKQQKKQLALAKEVQALGSNLAPQATGLAASAPAPVVSTATSAKS